MIALGPLSARKAAGFRSLRSLVALVGTSGLAWTGFVAADASAQSTDASPQECESQVPRVEPTCNQVSPQWKVCKREKDEQGQGYVVRRSGKTVSQDAYYILDASTYTGWLTYHAFCYICHSDKATGGAVTDRTAADTTEKATGGAVMNKTAADKAKKATGGVATDGTAPDTAKGQSANLLKKIRCQGITIDFFRGLVREGNADKGMPAWKDNPIVSTRYESVFSYLRARADGQLPELGEIPLRIFPHERFDTKTR